MAAFLMRMALALLDRGDSPLAAARLRHALDVLEVEQVAGRRADADG